MGKRNIILIILLIVIGIILIISIKTQKEKEQVHHFYLFKNLKLNNISELKIKNFSIKNDNGTWKIGKILCNKHKIEYLINLLKNQDFSNVISTNKNNFEKFDVTDKDALVVAIKTKSGKNYKIYIGKITPDGNGCYIRYNDKIFLITQNIKLDFNKTEKEFYLVKPQKDNSTNIKE